MASEIVITGTRREIFAGLSDMEFDKGKTYVCRISAQGMKRSLNANAYAWVLLQKLAEKLGTTKNELYLKEIEETGPFDYYMVIDESKAIDTLKQQFRVVKDRGVVELGKRGTDDFKRVRTLQCWKGSSSYDTKEMARFLDMIIAEAKAQGIETETPDEVERMKATWGK